ncbi:MAG: sodium/glutamate symporter [Lachnospiraceae bacterium]|nr:sodium/glutamate symporter [Lachnospiraceae bacterium]
MAISLDMYQTLGIAAVVLIFGGWLRSKIRILDKFCIPAPVVGGLIYALLMWVLHAFDVISFEYDSTLKDVCMIAFFTTVGFQADFKTLKKGGKSLIVFLVLILGLIFAQNSVALGISKLLGVDILLGLSTGSIPMVGGHGTAGAFGPILEDFGMQGATTICTAAATFGLVTGSLMGGPVGQRLIKKHHLSGDMSQLKETEFETKEETDKSFSGFATATYQIAISMAIGTVVSALLSKTGMTLPAYIGSMIVAVIFRNITSFTKKYEIALEEISVIGEICLSLFLGIAMITLKLWQLASLAVPFVILLLGQTLLMFLFAYFVVFNLMGRDYDAAVLSAGACGFGMGATPNAMANMQAITNKYGYSVKAYILVPLVGGMFVDFINSMVITLFINIIV